MIAGFGEIAEHLRRSTVHVGVGSEGQGSGVIWEPSGLIITNAHVARGDSSEITLWDGRRYPASTLFRDDSRDLAALRIQAPGLEAAPRADSSKLRAGEVVIAVGNPLGFVGALTTGVVHTVGPLPGILRRDYVQATVRLAPGNSGGPLADARGRVVGINSMVVAGGLGLAVPSNDVGDFLAREGRRVLVGVAVRPVTVRFRSRQAPALVVVDVSPGSPAASASLMVGDILVAAGDQPFESFDDLSWAIENAERSGEQTLSLRFLRGDRRSIRETTLALKPVEAMAA